MDSIPAGTVQQIEKMVNTITKRMSHATSKDNGNRAWTKEVLGTFRKIGKERKWLVWPNWLYDLICYSTDNAGRLTNLHLVLECEWDLRLGEIKWDFEKLLVSKASLKVLVCQASDENGTHAVFAMAKNGIKAFKKSGSEIYIIAVYNQQRQNFESAVHDEKGWHSESTRIAATRKHK